ncbi:MAG: CsbD family protein [Gemmatimonadetes bacterium]|uniref:CsbD family protein n=1 Tax=Candidatus Kutchimonas denitrificans TaxID=3056748 RepID=A0AAE5CCM2_9BACT|nr:CsbD family protein [Gemmatimonadota bacterium]NIR76158.1 CsbD family protein [Candidatus Kutchimonas denitrificans]NIS00537.1 CsbD family protein [Gemmatimonadota bacterium]NIT66195.1 CsbD family protein [Gemmatimonadota bacterium]NIU54273.1 CsbD family protein [Gemmatimonadota bacterium]
MNWDRIEGNWKEYKGKVKERWGKLTDGDLQAIEGKRDQLIGKLQQTYGMAREEAEQQIKDFLDKLGAGKDDTGEATTGEKDTEWQGDSAGTH